MRTTFAALRIRNYRLFAAGSLVSNTGTWMQRVAQDWLVLALTGSAGALGLTTGLQFLPILLFSPIAGVLADRFSKRSVMMVTQIAMSTTAALLGVLAITGVAQAWHVYAIAFAFGTAAAFDAPARQAFVNEMVGRDTLTNAVALNSASFNLGRMIGPAVAGGVIALLGSGVGASGWVILLNSASYLAVLVALKQMRSEELHPVPPLPRAKGQLRDGIAYVRSRPDIMLVMAILFVAGTFGFNFQMTTALMATQVYDKGAGEYGILGSILAIGSLTGALIAARRTSSSQRLVVASATIFGLVTCRRRLDADLSDVRPHPSGRRDHVDDADDGCQLVRPDGGRSGHARPGHGPVHGRLHGRHADRSTPAGMGRRTRWSALDADRWRWDHRPRHGAHRRLRRPPPRRRADPVRLARPPLPA